MKAFYQFRHYGATVVEGYDEIESIGTRFIRIKGAITGYFKCNLLYVDGKRRIDIPEIVPDWWDDPLIVAIKVAEEKAKQKNYERPIETSDQANSAMEVAGVVRRRKPVETQGNHSAEQAG